MGLMDAPRGMRLHTAIGRPQACPDNDGRGIEALTWV
jgi:hypothetical protein